jgi:Flp pilus assembly protein TadG
MLTFQHRKRERGQALVEFAFVFPIFLGVLIGLMSFAILFYSYVTIQLAVREGASAIVHDPKHQYINGTGGIKELVISKSFSLNTSQLTVVVNPTETQWVSGAQVTVLAAYYVPLPTVNVPVLGNGTIRLGTIQISAQSVMTIE